MATLIKEIADETNSDGTRQMACIVFKNMISNGQEIWCDLIPQLRENIKEAILETLASPSSQVRSQVASLVAAIASIEIPRGEWGGLIPSLCQNSAHQNLEIRMASLQTLGYLCEELSVENVSNEYKNQIMIALTNSIVSGDENVQTCKLAVKALLHSVPYTSQNFTVAQERDYIMLKVFEALKNNDVEVRENAMQVLVEIGRQEYDYVEFYFQQIAEATATSARNDQSKVGAQGIEFWTTMAEEETSRLRKGLPIKNYIRNFKDDIIKLLLDGIRTVQIEEDEEDDEWGVAMSSGCCLQKVAILLQSDVMTPVIAFVQQYIASSDWKERYASLIALGAITEGPSKQDFNQIIMPSFHNLLAMFNDSAAKVREAISWVISKICEHHAEVVTQTPEQTAILV